MCTKRSTTADVELVDFVAFAKIKEEKKLIDSIIVGITEIKWNFP